MPRKRKQSFLHEVTTLIRNRLISGLLVLVPLGITVFIMSFVLRATVVMMLPLTRVLLGDFPPWVVFALSLFLMICVLYLVGLLTTHVIGRKIIAMSEWIVSQIPFVKTIYNSSKQVVDVFQSRSATGVRQVALVEFPGPGLRALGFVTGEITLADGSQCYKVFIPTTPNPTTGFLQFVQVERIQLLDLSTEEAFRLIMSGGVLAPDTLFAAGTRPPDEMELLEDSQD